jgi:hypothetical protein
MSKILYSATDEVHAVVDGAPVGPMGRLYSIPVGEAVEVPDEVARFILDHLGYTGVVLVEETKTKTGVEYGVEDAHEASLKKLEASDLMRFQTYVSACVEDYVKRSKPVPAPPESILRIIERRGYDLRRFGIIPIGWEEPQKDARVKQLEDQVAALTKLVAKQGKNKGGGGETAA